jgi:hypothetical protein
VERKSDVSSVFWHILASIPGSQHLLNFYYFDGTVALIDRVRPGLNAQKDLLDDCDREVNRESKQY